MIQLGAQEDPMQTKVDYLESRIDHLKSERDTLNREYNHYKTAQTDLTVPLHKELKRAVEELAELRPEVARLQEQISSSPEISPEMLEKYHALEKEVTQLREEKTTLDALKQQNQELLRDLNAERKYKNDILQEAEKSYKRTITALQEENAKLKEENENIDKKHYRKINETSGLLAQIAASERTAKQAQQRADQLIKTHHEEKIVPIERKNAELTQRNESLVKKVAELTEKTVELQHSTPNSVPSEELQQRFDTVLKEKNEIQKKYVEMDQAKRDLKADNDRMRQMLRAAGKLPSGKEMQEQQRAVAEQRKAQKTGQPQKEQQPQQEGPLKPGDLCMYLTNEAGWREGKIQGYNAADQHYDILDTEKGWVLQQWPAAHVERKRAKVTSIAASLKAGDSVEALFDGKWYEGVIKSVNLALNTCDLTWKEDGSFTPSLSLDQVRQKNLPPSTAVPANPAPQSSHKKHKKGKFGKGGKGGGAGGKGGKSSLFGTPISQPYPGAHTMVPAW